MRNTKIKTGKLLLSMASAAVIFVGGINTAAAATLNTQVTTHITDSGTSAITLASGATGVAPAIFAGAADTREIHSLYITEEPGVAGTITVGSHALCTQPIKHTVALIASSIGAVRTIVCPSLAPGDDVKIYITADDTGFTTLLSVTALSFAAFDAATIATNDSKTAKLTVFAPNAPTYTPLAGVDYTFKATSISNILKLINKL